MKLRKLKCVKTDAPYFTEGKIYQESVDYFDSDRINIIDDDNDSWGTQCFYKAWNVYDLNHIHHGSEFEDVTEQQEPSAYSSSHYDFTYVLTEDDIKNGKIRMDAYFVANVWRTGSRDNSGALWHSLKTIARFGDKNDIEREIKALYNQAKALARINNVKLDD